MTYCKLLLLLLLVVGHVDCRPKIRNFHLSFAGDPFPYYYVTFDVSHKYSSVQVRFGPSESNLSLRSTQCTSVNPETSSVYYQAGVAHENLWSPVFHVRRLGVSQHHRVWVDGDLGIVTGRKTTQVTPTIAAFAKVSPTVDLALHPGDISYANSHASEYETWYSRWFSLLTPGITSVPYMVSPGNHEANCAWITCWLQTSNFTTYKERFKMPGKESGSGTPMWYSFNYGPVHYLSFSTETDYAGSPHDAASGTEATRQLEWIEQDLKNVNRSAIPWIVAYGHRPWYNNEPHANNPSGYPVKSDLLAVMRAFEPLFTRYRVDLHISGHIHNYQRAYPCVNGTLVQRSYNNSQAMINLVVGGAGQRHGIEGVEKDPKKSAPWYATGYGKTGYGILDVHNGTHLTWSYYDSSTMKLVDEIKITKTQI